MPQPSKTRWSPTPEQLMILEEIYRTAIRTPNSYQIQQITAHLSCYGRIESKNVFYWFQNHKAREKQKMRKRLCKDQHLRQQQQQQKHQINSYTYPQMFQLEFNHSPSVQHLHQLPFLSTFKQNLPPQGIYPEMEMKPMPMGSSTGCGNENCMMTMGMTAPIATAHPCCRPLKTLELFPIKSTGIKEEPETSMSFP